MPPFAYIPGGYQVYLLPSGCLCLLNGCLCSACSTAACACSTADRACSTAARIPAERLTFFITGEYQIWPKGGYPDSYALPLGRVQELLEEEPVRSGKGMYQVTWTRLHLRISRVRQAVHSLCHLCRSS